VGGCVVHVETPMVVSVCGTRDVTIVEEYIQ